jgi:hypothetical protein
MLRGMKVDFEQLIALWARPLPAGDAAIAAFRRVYSDPVKVNGVEMTASALVERARAAQRAFADLEAVVLAQIDADTHTSVVFRLRGRHVGPLATPLGEVPATGKMVERQIIDVLGVKDGLIHEIWMVADELNALVQLGVLALAP